MSSTSSRPHRPSISPFRTRKHSPSPLQPPKKPPPASRPVTPSSSSSSSSSKPPPSISPVKTPLLPPDSVSKSKENVTVTVRFRPLSAREMGKGDEIAWYADGDNTVRNEYNPSIAYGFVADLAS